MWQSSPPISAGGVCVQTGGRLSEMRITQLPELMLGVDDVERSGGQQKIIALILFFGESLSEGEMIKSWFEWWYFHFLSLSLFIWNQIVLAPALLAVVAIEEGFAKKGVSVVFSLDLCEFVAKQTWKWLPRPTIKQNETPATEWSASMPPQRIWTELCSSSNVNRRFWMTSMLSVGIIQ